MQYWSLVTNVVLVFSSLFAIFSERFHLASMMQSWEVSKNVNNTDLIVVLGCICEKTSTCYIRQSVTIPKVMFRRGAPRSPTQE